MEPNSYSFTPETSVYDLVQKWPQVIPVFIKFQMACVGCNMSAFETLEDAANIYAIDPQYFMQLLEESIQASSSAA